MKRVASENLNYCFWKCTWYMQLNRNKNKNKKKTLNDNIF